MPGTRTRVFDRLPVSFDWLDFNDSRKFYALLNPGGHYLQAIFLTHPWLVVRRPVTPIKVLNDGRCIAVFLPARNPSNAIIR